MEKKNYNTRLKALTTIVSKKTMVRTDIEFALRRAVSLKAGEPSTWDTSFEVIGRLSVDLYNAQFHENLAKYNLRQHEAKK